MELSAFSPGCFTLAKAGDKFPGLRGRPGSFLTQQPWAAGGTTAGAAAPPDIIETAYKHA